MPVKVDELVVPLGARFADLLADVVELLAWLDDAAVDELELGREGFCGGTGRRKEGIRPVGRARARWWTMIGIRWRRKKRR